jgi:hypothetical protein
MPDDFTTESSAERPRGAAGGPRRGTTGPRRTRSSRSTGPWRCSSICRPHPGATLSELAADTDQSPATSTASSSRWRRAGWWSSTRPAALAYRPARLPDRRALPAAHLAGGARAPCSCGADGTHGRDREPRHRAGRACACSSARWKPTPRSARSFRPARCRPCTPRVSARRFWRRCPPGSRRRPTGRGATGPPREKGARSRCIPRPARTSAHPYPQAPARTACQCPQLIPSAP